jgi:putative oxidoreductase
MERFRFAGENGGDAVNSRIRSIAYDMSRWLVGGIFLYAGAVKAADVVSFAGEVANYQILPYVLNYLVAATLPYIEIVAGTLLVLNRRVRASALVIGGMNLVFIIVLASALARGLDIDCGCFGSDGQGAASVLSALIRDLAIMIPIIFIFRFQKKGSRAC